MRRLVSILLMAVLGLPLALPLLARGADLDGTLAVCCRRGGVHHCMGAMEQAAPAGSTVGSVQAKCPYCPGTVVSAHAGGMLVGWTAIAWTAAARGRVRVGQVRSRSHALRGEACPKRGPPTRQSL